MNETDLESSLIDQINKLERERDEALKLKTFYENLSLGLKDELITTRKAIEDAPHDSTCELANFSSAPLADRIHLCDCWKRNALEVKDE